MTGCVQKIPGGRRPEGRRVIVGAAKPPGMAAVAG